MFYNNKKIINIENRSIRLKRLSLKRIFVSKMEFKHTSKKVNITMYVYNEEKRILIRKLLVLMNKILNINKTKFINNKDPLSIINKLFLLNKQQKQISLINFLKLVRKTIIIKLNSRQDNLFHNNQLINKPLYKDTNKLLYTLYLYNNAIYTCISDKDLFNKYNNVYKGFIRKIYLEKEIKLLNYYKFLLILNKNKFRDYFLSKLKIIVSKFFNKEVEFNIINQKSAHLNSDIFTEAILIKLRNRKNKLLRIFKRFLRTVKIAKINKIRPTLYRLNKPYYYKINKVIYNNNEDLINNLLYNNLDIKSFVNNKTNKFNANNNIETYLLNSLKYKQIAGIRLEAKGRLTKRFTASRSIFKVK